MNRLSTGLDDMNKSPVSAGGAGGDRAKARRGAREVLPDRNRGGPRADADRHIDETEVSAGRGNIEVHIAPGIDRSRRKEVVRPHQKRDVGESLEAGSPGLALGETTRRVSNRADRLDCVSDPRLVHKTARGDDDRGEDRDDSDHDAKFDQSEAARAPCHGARPMDGFGRSEGA